MGRSTTNIVVVGGGTGGTLAANLLAKELRNEIHDGDVRVILVSASRQHIFQPNYLHIAFKNQDPKEIVREESSLVRREVSLVEESAQRIDLSDRKVTLASGETLSHDYLVIATGSVPNPSAVPGLAEGSFNFHTSPEDSKRIWDAIQ